MIPRLDNYGKPTAEYVAKLEAMTDDELVRETSDRCWLSAYAANNPRSDYHWQTDALYSEASRRERPWLYQRGWNSAYRLAGYEPTEHDLELAREAQP